MTKFKRPTSSYDAELELLRLQNEALRAEKNKYWDIFEIAETNDPYFSDRTWGTVSEWNRRNNCSLFGTGRLAQMTRYHTFLRTDGRAPDLLNDRKAPFEFWDAIAGAAQSTKDNITKIEYKGQI